MDAHRSHYDVAIIGGGPVGSVAALMFAQAGRSVILLEANPKACRRLAGEWLHPPAVETLAEVGITEVDGLPWKTGRGFVVYPDDGSEHVVLPYSNGTTGLGMEHAELVNLIRDHVHQEPGVDFLLNARVTDISGQSLTYQRRRQSGESTISAGLIIGAGGRSSIARRSLNLDNSHITCSRMAGVVLRDCEVPYEGYGHVVLGAPGPVLIYRIGENKVRVCIDVHTGLPRGRSREAMLWDAYHHIFPQILKPAFRRALERRDVLWAANQIHPRVDYGREGLVLVGDSVGHYHPLTAMGMTLGFGDVKALLESGDASSYRRRRMRESRVPEMLAIALYEVFADSSDETVAMRRAIYRMWRDYPYERARTMRFLGCQDQSLFRFVNSFLKTMRLAARDLFEEGLSTREWMHIGRLIGDLGDRARWLFAGALHLTAAEPTEDFTQRTRQAYNGALNAGHPKAEVFEHPRLRAQVFKQSLHAEDPRLALVRGVRALAARQRDDGAWEGEVSISPLTSALYVLACQTTGHALSQSRREGILKHFEQSQLPAGGWSWAGGVDEDPSLLVTALTYVAARLLGSNVEGSLARQARRIILQLGGAEAIPNYGKLWLAVLGIYQWKGVNPTAAGLWSLPGWRPVHPKRMQAHTRQLARALSVICAQRPVIPANPILQALREEMFRTEWKQVDFSAARSTVRDEECVNGESRGARFSRAGLELLDRLQTRGMQARSARRLAEDIRASLHRTGFAGLSPFTAVLEALALWSVDPSDSAVAKTLAGFDHWIWEDEVDGARIPATRSRTWDTALAMKALTTAAPHLEFDLESCLERADEWLLDELVRGLAEGNACGWCFDAAQQSWPLSDATAEALAARLGFDPEPPQLDDKITHLNGAPEPEDRPRRVRLSDIRGAVRFVLSCQNADGGFGRFEARRSLLPLDWLSPVELVDGSLDERSWLECTAAACCMLAESRERLHPSDPMSRKIDDAMMQARRWLHLQQRVDGSWRGEWGICFIYGTMYAIRGLMAAGTVSSDASIRKACAWLMARQHADGGWGEHRESAVKDYYIDHEESQAVQTAWAMTALLAADCHNWDCIERAAHFLAATQLETGEWPEQEPVGLAFSTAALDFALYRTYFPVWALGLYEGRRLGRLQVPDSPGGRQSIRLVK